MHLPISKQRIKANGGRLVHGSTALHKEAVRPLALKMNEWQFTEARLLIWTAEIGREATTAGHRS